MEIPGSKHHEQNHERVGVSCALMKLVSLFLCSSLWQEGEARKTQRSYFLRKFLFWRKQRNHFSSDMKYDLVGRQEQK